LFCACLKQEPDVPPDMSDYDPKLPVNMTIAGLKDRMEAVTTSQKMDSSWTIYGIITADDRSGNFYKQITIADSTGGITILIDAYSLYARYPVGRKIYVALKGLYYGLDAKLPVIGAQPDPAGIVSSIPGTAIDSFITRANVDNELPVVQFDDLAALKQVNSSMLNRLVRVRNIQFSIEDTSRTFALPPAIASGTSIHLYDCYDNKIVLRTSGYANFREAGLPDGNGTITALYTVYNNSPQLMIRDTSDVVFRDPRCDGEEPRDIPIVPIDSIRRFFTGATTVLGSYRITGVVISDNEHKNVSTGSYILQDGISGIMLYLSNNTSYKLGDSLVVDVSGASLKLYNGTLEIDNLHTSDFVKAAGNKVIIPVALTVTDVLLHYEEYESRLVTITGTLNGGTTMNGTNGNLILTDNTGIVTHFTAPGATFKSDPLPLGQRKVTGYIGKYNSTIQIRVRSMTDIE
jgi:hypothetical protein